MRFYILFLIAILLIGCNNKEGNSARPDENQTTESIDSKKQNISDTIQVEMPLPDMTVTSPLAIKGKARGYWFFEADAPVVLLNNDLNQVAKGFIQADGVWMTTDFVSFHGSIEFDAPEDERGFLLFKRANPSGKKENDQEYRIPIIFFSK